MLSPLSCHMFKHDNREKNTVSLFSLNVPYSLRSNRTNTRSCRMWGSTSTPASPTSAASCSHILASRCPPTPCSMAGWRVRDQRQGRMGINRRVIINWSKPKMCSWWSQVTCLCVSDIDRDFKTYLAKLVPLLLAPEQLVEKEIGGNKVTCRDLLEYFKVLQDLI